MVKYFTNPFERMLKFLTRGEYVFFLSFGGVQAAMSVFETDLWFCSHVGNKSIGCCGATTRVLKIERNILSLGISYDFNVNIFVAFLFGFFAESYIIIHGSLIFAL